MDQWLTEQALQKCLPRNKNIKELLKVFKQLFPQYEINTPIRVAAFLSQCGHESLDFTVLRENLNYSAEGLRKVFSKYFPTDELAQQYARQPQKIANRVYANRMGNGPEESGDGWLYRGRGAIQITGKNNYMAFASYKQMTLQQAVDYCETLDGAIESACWFWKINNLNTIADTQDIEKLTRRINGGVHGLENRQAKYRCCLQALTSSV